MSTDRMSWVDGQQPGDQEATSLKSPWSRSYRLHQLANGPWLLLVKTEGDGEGWVLLATYTEYEDGQQAADYYDFWGRIPNHVPRADS
jgi:hypothetical protein